MKITSREKGETLIFLTPRCVSPFSRGEIFTNQMLTKSSRLLNSANENEVLRQKKQNHRNRNTPHCTFHSYANVLNMQDIESSDISCHNFPENETEY